jgi:hypothetical protein
MVELAETVWRDFETDGVPSSGAHDPRKRDIREWGAYVETGILGGSAGAIVAGTKAGLDSGLNYDANTMAWVLADPTVGNNGIYQKSGPSGTGSWVRRGDLPYSFMRATDAGAGTANAIVATTSTTIPTADGAALIALNIFETNTGSATVSFNGGPALTIKTNNGNDLEAGYLGAGAIVAGYVSGSTFRLISDVATAADRAAAEAAAAAAAASAASVNLPPIEASTFLRATSDADGYETLTSSELLEALGEPVNVKAHGARGDAKYVTVSTSAGSTTVLAAGDPFAVSVPGMVIRIDGAGTGGAAHVTTIVTRPDANTIIVQDATPTANAVAKANYGTDDTDAFDVAFALADAASLTQAYHSDTNTNSLFGIIGTAPVYVPPGHYMYSGTGWNPAGRVASIYADAPGSVVIELTSDVYLVDHLADAEYALNSFFAQNIICAGGKGLHLNRRDTQAFGSQAFLCVDNCQIIDFSECAIGSVAYGNARWRIPNCNIETTKAGVTKGILLSPNVSNPNLWGTSITGATYKVAVPDESGSGNSFLSGLNMFNRSTTDISADFWIMTGAESIHGRALNIAMCNLSGEQREGKPWVLIADVDESTGTGLWDRGHSTDNPTVKKYARDIKISGNILLGSGGSDTAGTGNVVESYTSELGNLEISGNDIATSFLHVLYLHNDLAEGYAANLQIGPNRPMGTGELPRFCNRPVGRWYHWDKSETPSPGTPLPANGGGWDPGFVILSMSGGVPVVPSSVTLGGSATAAAVTNSFGLSTAARQITFTVADETDYVEIPIDNTLLASLVRYQNIYVDIDFRSAVGALPLEEVDVEVRGTHASGATIKRKHVIPSAKFMEPRLTFTANEVLTGLRVRIYPSPDNFLAGVRTRVQIDNMLVYAANRPINKGHLMVANADWQTGHIVMKRRAGSDEFHMWPSWGSSASRHRPFIKFGAPTSGTDGFPLGVKVAVPATSTSPGEPGQWAADATHAYWCVATDSWARVAITTSWP